MLVLLLCDHLVQAGGREVELLWILTDSWDFPTQCGIFLATPDQLDHSDSILPLCPHFTGCQTEENGFRKEIVRISGDIFLYYISDFFIQSVSNLKQFKPMSGCILQCWLGLDLKPHWSICLNYGVHYNLQFSTFLSIKPVL